MTDWTMIQWHGTPDAAAAALRGLGWTGPDEPPAAALDPRVGGFIPAIGTMPSVFDGVAYVGIVASEAIALPPDLSRTGPELFRALLGSF